MLLLDKESAITDSARKIIILSDREDLQMQIAQLLRTRGLENIEIISADFLSDDNISFSAEETVGVIADIKNETAISVVSERVNAIVPQNMWCCIVGTCDSIAMAQKLLNDGILYFNSDSQLRQMVEKIISSGINIPRTRHTIKICVLGCKGGIGASFISSHIANQIALNKKVPILLAQGPKGSQDLDLLFDKKIQGDIVEYMPNLDLFKGEPVSLESSVTDKYNFIVYDQPIFNVDKDHFGEFFDYSNSFILVVDRRISSLRVAKQFLEQCERIRNTTGKPIRTFICVSDTSLEKSKLIAKADIEALLGCSVDAVIPFLKQTESKDVISVNLGRNGQKEINTLSMKVIGVLSRTSKRSENKGLFSSISRTLFK
ncbi:pilus assembly protein CpaE [Mesocricetibacter intestinalis]|uniref:Pilus assembly protein CpaE n=1 Tax=Mesocricetibacter intestinalis TaxID=1521930 RepID=A0A4R6V7Q6_9PAST|nr:pilus assembly protein [Mesocricetibacter intestinalis]TDQ57636.1 pilus assembly protein CpaE [Mesocricetibacter intestinalis]